MNSCIEIKSWDLYFTQEEFTAFNTEIALVKSIKLNIPPADIKKTFTTRIFECSYDFYQKFPSIKCINCALSELIYETHQEICRIETHVSTQNFPTDQTITSYTALLPTMVNSLVKIQGTVCRVGCRQAENLVVFFECTKCRKLHKIRPEKNTYKPPTVCSCRNKGFVFLSNHPEMVTVDKQLIKLHEIYSAENPKTLEVICYSTFVGVCAPGDVVEVVGLVKAELIEDSYSLKVECNNLKVMKNKHLVDHIVNSDIEVNIDIDSDQINITDIDSNSKDTLNDLAREKNILGILASNLFPDVIGHEMIKLGIILSLFGGTKKYVEDVEIRPEIHTLIVGDPGLGKSKLLLDAVQVLPKSTYISGNSSTTVGLTVSITHDPVSGEFMADAGALVLSDNGVCCIDEFDKIDSHAALFEAMEEQTVTVAKAGVVCSVPTRTTIIAASNPKHGHFNAEKSIRDNLKFDVALLSRFDQIFILRDNFTAKENYEISNQILKKKMKGFGESTTSSKLSQLMKKIKTSNAFYEETDRKIEASLIRRYVEYARNEVFPVMSTEAQKIVREFYLEQRNLPSNSLTTRHLESLIRITEAFAKVELRPIASASDAQRAVKFYRRIYENMSGGESAGKTKVTLEGALEDYVREKGTDLISREELCSLIEKTETKKSPRELIEIMNYRGILVKKKDSYKINKK